MTLTHIFPTVLWDDTQMTFLPLGQPLPSEASVFAVLVFATSDARFVVADIPGRGWCIPSGRLEAGETPEQAAHREAWEEVGILLEPLRCLGHIARTELATQKTTLAVAFAGKVKSFHERPSGFESQGVQLLDLETLPVQYFAWNPLLEAVFRYAAEESTNFHE